MKYSNGITYIFIHYFSIHDLSQSVSASGKEELIPINQTVMVVSKKYPNLTPSITPELIKDSLVYLVQLSLVYLVQLSLGEEHSNKIW
jgi:hypothetical protein